MCSRGRAVAVPVLRRSVSPSRNRRRPAPERTSIDGRPALAGCRREWKSNLRFRSLSEGWRRRRYATDWIFPPLTVMRCDVRPCASAVPVISLRGILYVFLLILIKSNGVTTRNPPAGGSRVVRSATRVNYRAAPPGTGPAGDRSSRHKVKLPLPVRLLRKGEGTALFVRSSVNWVRLPDTRTERLGTGTHGMVNPAGKRRARSVRSWRRRRRRRAARRWQPHGVGGRGPTDAGGRNRRHPTRKNIGNRTFCATYH